MIGTIGSLIALAGCSTPPGPPEPVPGPYSGPAITVDSKGSQHVLVAELPNPGYRFTLDATAEGFNRRDVFVTFRRPNPAVLYPQTIVQQRLATSVNSQTPITVYARVVEFEDGSNSIPHAKAAESAAPTRSGP